MISNNLPIFKCPLNAAFEFLNYYKVPYFKDSDCLELLAQEWRWDVSFDLKKKAREIGITIILTDAHQSIVWVSNGFERMTEYEKHEAIGLTPRFLQGSKTSQQTNAKVRDCIAQRKPFAGSLLNYKKSGSLYECDVQIIPIFDHQKQLKNFIAFEREY